MKKKLFAALAAIIMMMASAAYADGVKINSVVARIRAAEEVHALGEGSVLVVDKRSAETGRYNVAFIDLSEMRIVEVGSSGYDNYNNYTIVYAFDFSCGYARFELDDNWHYVDVYGNVSAASFEWADDFHENMGRVCINGKYGFVNSRAELVIPAQFDDAYSFSDSLALVETGGKWGYIDMYGNYAIQPQFAEAGNFCCGLAPVMYADGSFGYIDKSGAQVIALPAGMTPGEFNEYGMGEVMSGDLVGFIDTQGNIVVEPQFAFVYDFSYGLAVTALSDYGYYGYINAGGNLVIEPHFDNAGDFVDGVAIVEKGGLYGVINTNGSYVVAPTYDDASLKFDGGLAYVLTPGGCGLIDTAGRQVLAPQADSFIDIADGVAAYQIGGEWYVYDHSTGMTY